MLLPDVEDDPSDWRRVMNNQAWVEKRYLDVFEESGRYLGEVEIPDGYRLNYGFSVVFVDGDLILVIVTDSEGVQYLKRYRLSLPH